MKRITLPLFFAAALALPICVNGGPPNVRLFEIYALRIVPDESGFQTIQRGLFDSYRGFRILELGAFPPGVIAPYAALNRTLVTGQTWLAYDALGSEAFSNFQLTGESFSFGGQIYFPVIVSPEARLDLGALVNISTRATVSPGEDPVIGGFVIDDLHRWVLIRGVGPGLAALGVANPLPDPYITLYRHGSGIGQAYNDNWGDRPDAGEIAEVAKRVGAFPLSPDSKDAAYLIELEPGGYTVHLTTFGDAAGTALLEVYVLP